MLAFAGIARAQTPEGFKRIESPARGITLYIPTTFDEIPVPPDAQWLQMKFSEKADAVKKGTPLAEMRILRVPIKGVATNAPASQPAASQPAASQPAPVANRGPEFANFADFLKKVMGDWSAKADGTLDGSNGRKFERFQLTRKEPPFSAVAFATADGDESVAIICIAPNVTFSDLTKKFERVAKLIQFREPADELTDDIEAYYKRHPFRNADYRIKVRQSLPKVWKADDTENFIFVYDVRDQLLMKRMKHDLEVIRKKYTEMFPPIRPIEAVSTVRVCKDREEFLKFAEIDPKMPIAGFWNSNSRELVFYNNVKDPNFPTASWEDAFVVLYHEGFHQYIYYACGEIAPHSWFNEGLGDYFSGSKIGELATKVEKIAENPWRVGTVKKMVTEKTFAPLAKLVRFEQPEYYQKGGFYYAQGWSLIYFLSDPKVIKRHPLWGKILQTYLRTIVQVYNSELISLGANRAPDRVAAAQLAARKAATDAAFEDVDMAKMETEWKEFVLQLNDPRAK